MKNAYKVLPLCLALSAVLISMQLPAQHSLKLLVKHVPELHRNEALYVAGSFNAWNPEGQMLKFDKAEKYWYAEFNGLKDDVYEFKFTRGNWTKVQTNLTGHAVENNILKLTSDSTVEYSIAGWGDDFIAVAKKHSFSPNVSVMDSAFYMPELKTHRRIWIYLPPSYSKSTRRFPVLYMQDGQNLFDDYTSGYGEWKVDESLDSLIAAGRPACIVVGVDNGPMRMNEYNPFNSERFGEGDGDQYLGFMVNSLKPYIDKHYRTMPSKGNTLIAGSSMGGLLSYYAMLKYPQVYGKAGVFSPSFWTAPAINHLTDSLSPKQKGKFFFYAGGLEGETMIPDMMRISDALGANSGASLYVLIDPDKRHNEQAWHSCFAQFYCWIMAEGNNFVVDTKGTAEAK